MSSLCREIITLQLGHYSNFVGTHWWNLQDASLCYDPEMPPGEIQSDVMFREGQTLGGNVTYTPRLIAMDLKGSLLTLRQEGSLYDAGKDTSAISWDGSLMTHKESPPEKNSFLEDLDKLDRGDILTEVDFTSSRQYPCEGSLRLDTVNAQLAAIQKSYQLEGSVKVWSDFLRIHLHPRTISVIHQYNHDGEAERLEAFGQGESLLQGKVVDELDDKLHFFVEECDYFQGFQILCDVADGFAGLGSKVTEMLQDSYGGRGILTYGLEPVARHDSTPAKDVYRLLNCAMATAHLASNSSFYCPLTLRGGLGLRASAPVIFPHLTYDPSLWYHSSAVLALALDALTVPYRRRNGVPMWQLADSLSTSGRKVVAAYGAVPFPMVHGDSLPDALSACADSLPWKPLSTCPEAGEGGCYGQWVTLKGVEEQRLTSHVAPGTEPSSPFHHLCSGEDVLASYVTSFYPTAPLAVQLLSSPSKVTPPFPRIFSPSLTDGGLVFDQHPPFRSSAVSSVPVLTSLQSGPALDPWLSELHRSVSAFDVRRVAPSFLTHGPEMADYGEALEQLRLLARRYRDDSGGATRSSSEDDDD
ncbi:protein misato homolog 1 [Nerophis lumbriciformis]|uniref:protein misato homolog 1 n=1 Tax=Nerophis lumbriciformis TaxID=546530 RepID=UPI002ADFCA02|nr:protein misato homolog 1-like [Nerophis lumbriciformis]